MEKIAAIVTPKEKNKWSNELLISQSSFYSLLHYLNTFGFFDILFLGYTGEWDKLSLKEAREVLDIAEEYKCELRKRKKEGKVMVNVTRNKKEESLELIRNCELVDFIMIERNGLENKDLFLMIRNSKKPIIYYLKKERDNKNEFLEYLLTEEKILGIKDSLKEGYEERKKIVENCGKKYYFGNDLNFLKEKKGNLISGTIQLFPQLWKEERYEIIEKIVEKILEKEEDVEFPKICKYMLSYSPPFVPLIKNDDLEEETIKKLEDLKDFYIKLKKENKF
jgi:dihydrodipicolinate synthase/N-acetylneuraminate lyase